MKSSIFENNGVSLNYYQTGEGKTDLLFHHGLYNDGLCWGNFPRDLGKKYRVTLMDGRGFGLSSHPGSGYDMDTMAQDMASLINHLGLIKPVAIGHSMGASLACHLAALYPRLLNGAILIDPAFREPSESSANEEAKAKRASELRVQQAMSRDQLIGDIRAKHPNWPDEFVLPLADARFRMDPKALAIMNSITSTWKHDLTRITRPVLLITGDIELGAIVSKETADFVCKTNPNFQSLNISGAAHSIHHEKYSEVLKGMENFLESTI
jgi:N-formylmaleamate deformylase